MDKQKPVLLHTFQAGTGVRRSSCLHVTISPWLVLTFIGCFNAFRVLIWSHRVNTYPFRGTYELDEQPTIPYLIFRCPPGRVIRGMHSRTSLDELGYPTTGARVMSMGIGLLQQGETAPPACEAEGKGERIASVLVCSSLSAFSS